MQIKFNKIHPKYTKVLLLDLQSNLLKIAFTFMFNLAEINLFKLVSFNLKYLIKLMDGFVQS